MGLVRGLLWFFGEHPFLGLKLKQRYDSWYGLAKRKKKIVVRSPQVEMNRTPKKYILKNMPRVVKTNFTAFSWVI